MDRRAGESMNHLARDEKRRYNAHHGTIVMSETDH